MTSKISLSPPVALVTVFSKVVVLLLINYLLLLPIFFGGWGGGCLSFIGPCFVILYLVSFLCNQQDHVADCFTYP